MGLFSRSVQDRSFCAFLSLLLMALTGFGLFKYFTIDHSNDNPDWVLRLFLHIGMDIVALSFILPVCGLIWAFFTPLWLERATRFCLDHLVEALFALLLVIVDMLTYSFLA